MITTNILQFGYFLTFGTVCQSVTGTGISGCDSGLPKVHAGSGTIPSILQMVFGIIAALAVLMIVIAGMRFVTGQGNPQEMSKARSTIVYALVGLLVALSAEAIVTFVLVKL